MSPKKSAERKPGNRKTAAKKPAPRKTNAAGSARKKTAKVASKKTARKPARTTKSSAKKTPGRKSTKTTAKTTAKDTAKTTAKTRARKAAKKATTPKRANTATGRAAGSTTSAANAAVRKPRAAEKTTRAAKQVKARSKNLDSTRARLQKELDDLLHQKRDLEEAAFVGTQSDMTGETGIDEDFADAGTATFERERDLSIRNNISDLIDLVTRAINRIDDGTYGACERCGRQIDPARLKALPHAVLCMDCKRREERAR